MLIGQKAPPRRRKQPVRRPVRRKPRWVLRGVLGCVFLVAALLAWGAIARALAPKSNTARTRFDAIVVLGVPADPDGNPTPLQLATVTEAVHEYERGVAPRLILTGGAVANRFVEARVMAKTAHAQGVPESALFVEPDARDTIHNACYAARILKSHGWGSAEVVSAAAHLPRTGLILSRLPLEWRTHAAPPLSPEEEENSRSQGLWETLKTARYLAWTRQTERCEP